MQASFKYPRSQDHMILQANFFSCAEARNETHQTWLLYLA